MKIGFAQINPTVGDLRGNFEKIAGAYDQLARAGADIVIAPELAVTGYPPKDLVFKSRFVPENLAVLDQLQKRLNKPALLVGFVIATKAAVNLFIMLRHCFKQESRCRKLTS